MGCVAQDHATYVYPSVQHMYDVTMKPITITIPEELDQRAVAEAKRRGISKSELIRRGLMEVLPRDADGEAVDSWREMAGFGSPDVATEPGEIDRVVYGA